MCFQNGLCEPYVEEFVGAEARDRRHRGVGRLDGGARACTIAPRPADSCSAGWTAATTSRFAALRALLEPIGPVELTHNLSGARWSKLAINCAISSLGTIGGERLGELLRHRFVRRLGLEVMTEAVAVARRCGVQLEKVSGTLDLNWIALTPADVSGPGSPSLLAKHAVLLAVGAKYRRLRSSMLIAIERGREPAVDFLNGEVVRRARELGIAGAGQRARRDADRRHLAARVPPRPAAAPRAVRRDAQRGVRGDGGAVRRADRVCSRRRW